MTKCFIEASVSPSGGMLVFKERPNEGGDCETKTGTGGLCRGESMVTFLILRTPYHSLPHLFVRNGTEWDQPFS